jgi:hypothetical protein
MAMLSRPPGQWPDWLIHDKLLIEHYFLFEVAPTYGPTRCSMGDRAFRRE